jgi:hypothetical protein
MVEKLFYLLIIVLFIQDLKNIDFFFLSPDITLKIQLYNAMIIQAFKIHCGNRFYQNLLENYEIEIPI